MSLGTFKTLVAAEVNKGTLHDAAIAARIRMAARWIERNYSLRYMHRWVGFTIDSTVSDPRLIVPPPRVRSYDFFRLLLADGTYCYLDKVAANDVFDTPTSNPTRYWTDGDLNLVLDKVPQENLQAELGYWQYSNWDSLADANTHWLLDNAEDALLFQTMVYMGPFLRESTAFLERYMGLREQALSTLITADEAFTHGASEQVEMEYRGN